MVVGTNRKMWVFFILLFNKVVAIDSKNYNLIINEVICNIHINSTSEVFFSDLSCRMVMILVSPMIAGCFIKNDIL